MLYLFSYENFCLKNRKLKSMNMKKTHKWSPENFSESHLAQGPISRTDLSLFWGLNPTQSDNWLSLSLFEKLPPVLPNHNKKVKILCGMTNYFYRIKTDVILF